MLVYIYFTEFRTRDAEDRYISPPRWFLALRAAISLLRKLNRVQRPTMVTSTQHPPQPHTQRLDEGTIPARYVHRIKTARVDNAKHQSH